MSNKSGTSPQVIVLPTGGGALSGLGEKFIPDLFTGTGNLSVPIEVPPGRNGFQPELNLTYSTGDGNGPFGLGWSMAVPSVSRTTAHGVPRYDEGSTPDTFVLSGSEDLVAVAEPRSRVSRYRPRTEGPFAHIDRVRDSGDVWRVSTTDGRVSTYGGGAQPAVVADPKNRDRIFRWLLTETTDPFGNRILYDYRRDTGVDGQHHWDQLHLDRVSYVDFDRDGQTRFLVTVTLVYEERPDPFSDYRSGFEIRTRLRCRRIEIHTHANGDVLARSYELEYLDNLVEQGQRAASDLPLNGASLLSRVRVVGHDGNRTEQLPPLDFEYSRFAPERQRFQPLEAAGDTLPPASLAEADLETVDLFGNGLPDIVHVNGSVRFWRNLGGGRFDRPQEMAEVPAGVHLADSGVHLADMNGDGLTDLLTLPQRGYFPLAFHGRWGAQGFVQYPAAPAVELGADDIRLVDLDGDGVVDALRTGPMFELFFNDPRRGWERVETRPRRPLAEFPDVTFSDPRVKLADLSGDGLQDIVLVERGRIDYWPYLGHGRWGRRVRMAGSPVFSDGPGTTFDPRRVLFGDLDGDGLDDVVYIQANRITCSINRGGGGWSEPFDVDRTPSFTDIDGVRLIDVLGTGMNGVLWSTDAVPGGGSHYGFLDLTGGSKPYLLAQIDNHMGAITKIRYGTSTSFYLADEMRADTRWKAPLPFPVHVVDRVDVIDDISGGRLTNQFRYHHGYWDGVEREFRGFGMVEQLDTEVVASAGHAPPVLTRTWFHQGPVGQEADAFEEPDRATEYWIEDPPALGHVDSVNSFLRTVPHRVRRDALRSLRGSTLRREVFALDGSPLEDRPIAVREHAYGLREEYRPRDSTRRHVFFPHLVAERNTQWERGTDPMTELTFHDEYDAHGQSCREIHIAVPRGRDYRTRAASSGPYLGTMTTTGYAQRDDEVRFIVDRVAATTTHEIGNDGQPTVFELRDAVRSGTAPLTIVGQTLIYYDGQPFEGLALHQLGDFGAAVRTESLVLTDELVAQAHDDAEAPPYLHHGEPPPWTDDYPEEFRTLVPSLAGYTFVDGADAGVRARGYFAQTTRHRYDFHSGSGRGLIIGTRDPVGNDSTIKHDRFGLFPLESTDGAGLSTRAVYDHRVLRPRLTTDVNGNRTAVAYTPLGLLERVAVMGKPGERVGDTLGTPGTRYSYDFGTHAGGSPPPVSIRTVRRVHHVKDTDVAGGERDKTVQTVEYSDGFGRLVQTRASAEDVRFGDPVFGAGILPTDQSDSATQRAVTGRPNSDAAAPNVVVNGWQIYDNKGRVVERFEPFFSTGWEFSRPDEAQLGQRRSMRYDAQGRLIRTIGPDGSEERMLYGVPGDIGDPDNLTPTPWEVFTYDRNDNAGRTHPSGSRSYDHHWNTPSSITLDALRRPVARTGRNRSTRPRPGDPPAPIELVRTQITYDIVGNGIEVTDALGRPVSRDLYDLAARVIRSESLDGGTHQTVFDAAGRQIERRDTKGALTLHAYDVLGRDSRLWARDGSTGDVTLRERIEYGDRGDPRQPSTQRAVARTFNLLGRVQRHYDEAGLVTIIEADFKGNILERNRHVVADEAILSGADRLSGSPIDWTVEPNDTLESRAANLLDAEAYETSSRYDALGRTTMLRCPAGTDGARRVLSYSFNDASEIEGIALDGEPVVEHVAYDAAGKRTLVALGNGIMTRHAYDARTSRLLRTRTERVSKTTQAPVTLRPTGAALQDIGYRYDRTGNVIAIVDHTPGSGVAANPTAPSIDDPRLRALVASGDALVQGFSYDSLYRLISATGRECTRADSRTPWADLPRCGFNRHHGTANQHNAPNLTTVYRQDFTYDAVGNLLQSRHTGSDRSLRRFEVAPGSNRLATLRAGSSAVAYRHDAVGNLLREGSARHFTWDHDDRLVSFRTRTESAEPSLDVRYLYSADGTRVKKLVRKQGGTTASTTYIDGIFEHHSESGVDGAAMSSVHVIESGRRVLIAREGIPHRDDRGPAVQYQLGDHLGNTTVVVDDRGDFVNREEFTPYGETLFGGFSHKRYRFNGKEREQESGLGYHGARYYAPWLGRWTTCDPEPPDPTATAMLSAYSAFACNPLNFADPDGHSPEPPTRAQRVMMLVLRFLLGDDPQQTTPAGDPTPIEPVVDKAEKRRIEAEQEAEAYRREKRRGLPTGNDRHPGRWLPSGKRGQRAARRKEAQSYHPSEATTRQRRRLDTRNPARRPPATPFTGDPIELGGTGGGALRRKPGGGARGGLAVAGFAALTTFVLEGKPPSAEEVVVSSVPILSIASAKDHGDTVIPIILYFAGWKVTATVAVGVAVYTYAKAVKEQPVLAVPPAAFGLGQSAHFLGAKGGYGNLLCHPGKPGC